MTGESRRHWQSGQRPRRKGKTPVSPQHPNIPQSEPPPPWFAHPAVTEILNGVVPAAGRPGFCVWLTGIPCAGKSATATALAAALAQRGRQATILDGDAVRAHISRDLGFSPADRDRNVSRVAYLAAVIVRRGGIALCALVSPYAAARQAARATVGADRFLEVFVDTPLPIAEARDTAAGRYAKARRGEWTDFTAVNAPYEKPTCPELTLDTVHCAAAENAARIIRCLEDKGLL